MLNCYQAPITPLNFITIFAVFDCPKLYGFLMEYYLALKLVIVVLLIILINFPYTVLRFHWQWLSSAPKWNMFSIGQVTPSSINAFIFVHHVPHNSKYCYILATWKSGPVHHCFHHCDWGPSIVTSWWEVCFLSGTEGNHRSKGTKKHCCEYQLQCTSIFISVLLVDSYTLTTNIRNMIAVAYTSTIIINLID